MWAEAIKEMLEASPAIGPALTQWDFGDGVRRPAIFIGEVPLECASRRIVLTESAPYRYNLRGYRGGRVIVDVNVLGDRSMSVKGLGDLAYIAWGVLHRKRPTVTGFSTTPILAEPPGRADDAEGFPGFSFPCEITITESEVFEA